MINKVIDIVLEASKYMDNRHFTVQNKGSVSNNVTSAVIIDGEDDSFNKTYEKAWFLHSFYNK